MDSGWFFSFSRTLLSILLEALPYVLLGSLVSGIMEVFLPSEALTRILPKNRFLATLMGALAGLALPMCECGVIPVLRRLIRKGTPLNVALAYMLAAPMVNPIVILSTMVAFKAMRPYTVTGLRIGLGMVIAILTSFIVTAFAGKNPHKIEMRATALARPHWREGLVEALGHAGRDFIEIGAFLAIGAAIAAFLNLRVWHDSVTRFADRNVVATISMMGMAVVLNLCSEADAFVAWSFSDFSISSRLAFLVLGPMLDMKLVAMYTRVFRKRTILLLCGSSIVLVFTAIMILNQVRPDLAAIPWGEPENGLQCRLVPRTQTVEVAEGATPEKTEVYVTYQLRNVSGMPVQYLPSNAPVKIQVTDPDGEKVEFVEMQESAEHAAPGAFETLNPRAVSETRVRLSYYSSKLGDYHVIADAAEPESDSLTLYYASDPGKIESNPDNVWSGGITSNAVTVRVVRPRIAAKPAAAADAAQQEQQ